MSPRGSTDKYDVEVGDLKADQIENSPQVFEIGTFRVVGISREDADFFENFPEEKRKKVFRKVKITFTIRFRKK